MRWWLKQQVDLPVWEWLRTLPVAATAGLSCSCTADTPMINATSGRYIYVLLNATNFWRYDTIADSYEQLASPVITPLTALFASEPPGPTMASFTAKAEVWSGSRPGTDTRLFVSS